MKRTFQICLFLFFSFSGLNANAQDCPDSCAIYIPNTLTPDCDGIDCEFLEITTNCTFLSFHFYIYDRWGEVIFESTDPKLRFGCSDQKQGAYVWTLKGEYCNGKKIDYKGQLNIFM